MFTMTHETNTQPTQITAEDLGRIVIEVADLDNAPETVSVNVESYEPRFEGAGTPEDKATDLQKRNALGYKSR